MQKACEHPLLDTIEPYGAYNLSSCRAVCEEVVPNTGDHAECVRSGPEKPKMYYSVNFRLMH